MIHHLRKIKRNRWQNQDDSFVRSIIALSLLFFVTQIPYAVMLVIQTIMIYVENNAMSSTSTLVNFCYSVSLFFNAYNYFFPTVVNFIFNKLFREEFYALFGFKKPLTSANNLNN